MKKALLAAAALFLTTGAGAEGVTTVAPSNQVPFDTSYISKANRFGIIVAWMNNVFVNHWKWGGNLYPFNGIGDASFFVSGMENNHRDLLADYNTIQECKSHYTGGYWGAACFSERMKGDYLHPISMSDVEVCYTKVAWDTDKNTPEGMSDTERLARVKAATVKCDTVQSKRAIATYFKRLTGGTRDSDTIYVTVDFNFQ